MDLADGGDLQNLITQRKTDKIKFNETEIVKLVA